jgi:hypothetical protein
VLTFRFDAVRLRGTGARHMTTQAERNALADKLAAEYFGADSFVTKSGERHGDEAIFVSVTTRDAVIAALRERVA